MLKAGQMLDNGNACGKQQRVRGPLAVGGVVNVERVDADQRGITPRAERRGGGHTLTVASTVSRRAGRIGA